ncbi:MAG: pilus assembly protein [Betaproteobacteria bacterium]|nr:pilus assembly protein [Betaproteobacteria bacterium]
MNHPAASCHARARAEPQRGAALLIALVFLVILTLLGLAAMRTSGLEERMAGNLRDRSIAFQAAEAALRYAEQDIRLSGRVRGLSGFDRECTAGLCYNGLNQPFPVEVWRDADKLKRAVEYGSIDAAGRERLPTVAKQPRYLIEGFIKQQPGAGPTYFYRITARATGRNPNTVVHLQEVFVP